jgi:hypothetical protein
VRSIAAGPVEQVFTAENLRRTYGGRVAFLDGDRGGANGDQSAPLDERQALPEAGR